ncbi:hypothetical protein [Rubrimonas cliftonensis]|uniref:hypothetical protein n=1 Tax=Rubrimonas cliftonensis TaxID=89524 RepID=UPI001114FC0A|nr:hypothetical protein [Rubrimonas cliftonensis]
MSNFDKKDGYHFIAEKKLLCHPTKTRLAIEMMNAVALPSRDIPFDEIISFRTERLKELRRFWLLCNDLNEKINPDTGNFQQTIQYFKDTLEDNNNFVKQNFPYQMVNFSILLTLSEAAIAAVLAYFAIPNGYKIPVAAIAGGTVALRQLRAPNFNGLTINNRYTYCISVSNL